MKPILKKYNGVWICKTNHYKRMWKDLTQIERIHIHYARRWCDKMNNKRLIIDYLDIKELPNYNELSKKWKL